ncbi:glycoside hydrolase family 15 protein [Guyparkeria hydrothermalis]|uniref:glycoside hydrolase family 15 protein n=1 Tax=Guyparkeria hydrothermalis TaxID=923 RepID=UPI0020216861|nr:glycoside hydrolase family 15 protein [Guyparkeria hydrothermalis]MCL7750052.1 glycoside hydrolase family 15 protein [Guyparkeria hydrothermalis]
MTSGHALPSSPADDGVSLDALFVEVRRHILDRQHPISGLLPASTAVTAHGDYTDAWVRDNVYSILGPWTLGIACRRAGETSRAFELEQAVVRNMRGLLMAMMRQADRVERFKASLDPIDALHAKYDTATGEAVVGDEDWGHLQLDATSLYLLMLVQMTASGLTIVQGRDEVDFVQNLVWYLSRAYVVPDYGIWERGNKINHGVRELNASSLGLVLAALEAADGFDLFGANGDARSRLLVVPDDIARVRQCLDSILPRESASKEIDSALLAVTGFPAFAAGEKAAEVIERIDTRLAGCYGYKRFLRDGHQTAIEDESKLHYEPEELEAFARIECEWPLFFTYRLINACFAGDLASARAVHRQIESVAVCEGGAPVLPELYFVPADSIEAERKRPGSVNRLANENRPLVWAQSLWVVGRLLLAGCIRPADIDPIGRHRGAERLTTQEIGVALLARTETVADRLAAAGVSHVTREGRQRTSVITADTLVERLASFGANGHLALTGRPARRLLGLSAARVVATDRGETAVLPALFDSDTFLLGRDAELLVHEIRTSLAYLARHANGASHPIWVIPVDEWMLDGAGGEAVLSFCRELENGALDGMPVTLAHLDTLVESASRWVLPGELPPARPAEPFVPGRWECGGDVDGLAASLGESPSVDALTAAFGEAVALDERLALLRWLRAADVSSERRFADIDGRVGDWHAHGMALLRLAQRVAAWRVMRLAADLVGVVDGFLEVALMDLVVRQKRVAVGRSYSRRAVIDAPISNREILRRIHAYCGDDARERALTQELVIHLGAWLRASPELFDHVLTLRTGPLLQILVALRARESGTSPAQALDELVSMAPQELRQRLREAIDWRDRPERLEALHRRDGGGVATVAPRSETLTPQDPMPLNRPYAHDAGAGDERGVDWYHQREIGGAMSRLPERFYEGVWELLGHVPALVIGNRYDSRNVLDSQVYRGQSTAREHNFALAVEHRLNRIEAPEYRELTVEAIVALIEILTAGEDLVIEEPLVLDVVIGHAVRLAWMAEHPDDAGRYDDARADAWQAFYRRSPRAVAHWVGKALDYLLTADAAGQAGAAGGAGMQREVKE